MPHPNSKAGAASHPSTEAGITYDGGVIISGRATHGASSSTYTPDLEELLRQPPSTLSRTAASNDGAGYAAETAAEAAARELDDLLAGAGLGLPDEEESKAVEAAMKAEEAAQATDAGRTAASDDSASLTEADASGHVASDVAESYAAHTSEWDDLANTGRASFASTVLSAATGSGDRGANLHEAGLVHIPRLW